jgi:hypothetical protein
MNNDGERERVPTDDEYAELMRRAVETMRDADMESVWSAFSDWVDDQVEAGTLNRYEVKAAVFHLLGGDLSWWRSQTLPGVRAEVESAFFGAYLAKQPRGVQVEVLAGMWRAAEEHDRKSQQLFGWIKQMSRSMSRGEIARMMQAATDSYRAGEPLKMKDRVTLLAYQHLSEKTRIRRMGEALSRNGSKAQNHDEAASQMHSKAENECAAPLPMRTDLDGTTVRLQETYPLVGDMARHLLSRGIIRHVKIRDHLGVDTWSDESRAGIAASGEDLDAIVAEVDPQYEDLDVIIRNVDDDTLKVADPRQHD